jgi:Kef-type K+ transport system membrane component KefB
MTNFQIGIHMFLQLAVIIACCRIVGYAGRRWLGQTQVFMEMVAGVLLGPSLLGWIAPDLQAWLFPQVLALPEGGASVPHPNMAILYGIAQVGLVLYMFVIGLDFNVSLLSGRVRGALLVSVAGILVPFVVAAALAPLLHVRGDMFAGEASAGIAWLFLGASISITAFPMLARILYEHGLTGTPLGTLTLAAGAIDDAVAWCLLALVVALFQANAQAAVITIGGGLAYGLVMLTVGRKLLRYFAAGPAADSGPSPDRFALVLVVLLACAWLTDAIGIYAVFGAFVCGAAMPKGTFGKALAQRIEGVTSALLLPMFFVFSGLNTRIGLLDTPDLWGLTLLVILVATLGKGVACAVAARLAGQRWRDSAIIGTLMNARGLMELILLNIGLERGLISPTLFSILVLMAIVTTGMASPIYRWLSRGEPARAPVH